MQSSWKKEKIFKIPGSFEISLNTALQKKIKECTAKCDEHPNPENLNDMEILQSEYDRQYEYIAQGAIIRSRLNWYEHGEKSNNYFLNLEYYKKKKSCIRKLVVTVYRPTNTLGI